MTVSEMTDRELRSTIMSLTAQTERLERISRMSKAQREQYRAAFTELTAAHAEVARRAAA